MPKPTEQTIAIGARWSDFLRPLLGDGPDRASIPKLSAAIDEIAGREGDNRAEIYAWRKVKGRIPRAERVFEAGEALHACGIKWSTGIGALWAAGYLGEFTRKIINLAQIGPAVDDRAGHALSFRDLAAIVGTHAPLFASPGLTVDLNVDVSWLEKDRRAFGQIAVPALPDASRYLVERRKDRCALPCDELLGHAANLGDAQNIGIEIRERTVWTLVFEWAIKAASPSLRDGRIANLSGFLAARPRLLIESEREAAFIRARQTTSSPPRPRTRRQKR